MKTAIPSQWKISMINTVTNNENITITDNYPKILIKGKLTPIEKLNNKKIYSKLIIPKVAKPTSIETWINMFPFMENYEWVNIYLLSPKITTEPYFQSFQYKIINRIINCKDKLFIWGIYFYKQHV